MRKKSILQVVCTAMMLLLCSGMASALNVSHYATQSKLATGKWVKISIPETGVYEITNNELREMGFNNPSSVRLYGFGGNRISEVLNGLATDDLVSVPLMRYAPSRAPIVTVRLEAFPWRVIFVRANWVG